MERAALLFIGLSCIRKIIPMIPCLSLVAPKFPVGSNLVTGGVSMHIMIRGPLSPVPVRIHSLRTLNIVIKHLKNIRYICFPFLVIIIWLDMIGLEWLGLRPIRLVGVDSGKHFSATAPLYTQNGLVLSPDVTR